MCVFINPLLFKPFTKYIQLKMPFPQKSFENILDKKRNCSFFQNTHNSLPKLRISWHILSSGVSTLLLMLGIQLTLSHIKKLSDTSAADDFCRHCDKLRNCSRQAISPFPQCFIIYSRIVYSFLEFDNFYMLD